MRRRLIAGLLAGALIPGTLLFAGTAAAAEFGKHAIKFAFQNQKGHPQAEGRRSSPTSSRRRAAAR
jgi:hypothetical protein